MSQETEKRAYNNIALPKAEVSVLEDIEKRLHKTSALSEGERISLVAKDAIERKEENISFSVENEVVVALSLRYCELTSLPETFGRLSHVRVLDLTGNALTALPESLGNMSRLEKLFLDGNRLTSLPEALGDLQQLEELHIDRNALTSLPERLYELTMLNGSTGFAEISGCSDTS